jgi:tRNA A-37 threonylcarbamoyl transferase component Bud32
MSRALGRYELLRPLARGGMGEVYLARRRAAGIEKWLVVKRMRPERAGDARFLDLFMREARLSMSLAHQNIVPVFDFGRIDDQVFLAMERIEGKDLGSSLSRAAAPLSPLLAAFIAAECCQALDYAHRRRGPDGALLGIVHRDVTPRNVLLSWSGEVKLTDFGIAALAGDESKSALGTPAYMAPEQARGEPLDARADVYAVGLVLREALTGQRARAGADRDSTLAAARAGTLDPWGFAGPLREIVDKATAAAPDDRYADARAMAEDLDHFIVAERAANKGEGPARQLATWLATVWGDEREEGAIEEAIEGGHLVSFLDDGALDVIGTGTQRSLVATAADDAPAPEPPSGAALSKNKQSWLAPVAQAPAAAKKKKRWWLAPATIGMPAIAAIVGVAMAATSKPDSSPAVVDQTKAPPVDATQAEPVGTPPPEQAPPPVETKAPPVETTEAKRPIETKRPIAKKRVVDKEPPPATTHTVEIGAQPYWSYFTVDADPAQHTTGDPLQLAPGAHTLHFTGNPHYAADKTITIHVPDADGFKTVVQLAGTAPAP